MAGRQAQGPVMDPARFNQLARLKHMAVNTTTYTASAVTSQQLPKVGFQSQLKLKAAYTLTAAGSVSGRFRSGSYGGNTSRFLCPTGLINNLEYTLNSANPIYKGTGYLNYVLSQVLDSGPVSQETAAAVIGYVAQQRESGTSIYNTTDSAWVLPDAALTASKVYALTQTLTIPLALGPAAAVGLVPCQDQRTNPALNINFGASSEAVSVAGDISTLTGSVNGILEYFEAPAGILPDISLQHQVSHDTVGITGAGKLQYQPQLGGSLCQFLMTLWNSTKAMDPGTDWDTIDVRAQQTNYIEQSVPFWFFRARHRELYGKYLPDEVVALDYLSAAAGLPQFPNTRDVVNSAQLTYLDILVNIITGGTATSELLTIKRQLFPVGAYRG